MQTDRHADTYRHFTQATTHSRRKTDRHTKHTGRQIYMHSHIQRDMQTGQTQAHTYSHIDAQAGW